MNTQKHENLEEEKLVNEENIEFRIKSLRNKKIAEWASIKMHFDSDLKEKYIIDIQRISIANHEDKPIIDKIFEDIKNFGKEISIEEISKQLKDYGHKARTEIMGRSLSM